MHEVHDDVDTDPAAISLGPDQPDLVGCAADQHHPRPTVPGAAGLGLVERAGDDLGRIIGY
ncbi:hypothetical protein [Nocardiopsis rhodophaea]|uniref:hypothetical protein n=1 Tax=Nocardiopsis rhodophaea TaxID=280238 RepID=UPI0031E0476A